MSEQSVRDSKVSMTCARCSGRISEPIAFCPYCGGPLALSGGASFGAQQQGGDTTVAARYEPPMRSFATTDFEGDLDGPEGGFVDSGAEPRDGDGAGYGRTSAFALSSWRQWALKGGMGILASCVVLFAGLTLLHRFEGPSDAAVSEESASLAADGSATANAPEPANLSGGAKDDLRAQGPLGPGQGASEVAPGGAPPAVANEGTARSHSSRAGTAQRRHLARGRTRTHGTARKWRAPSRDTTYLHVDAQPLRRSAPASAEVTSRA